MQYLPAVATIVSLIALALTWRKYEQTVKVANWVELHAQEDD